MGKRRNTDGLGHMNTGTKRKKKKDLKDTKLYAFGKVVQSTEFKKIFLEEDENVSKRRRT